MLTFVHPTSPRSVGVIQSGLGKAATFTAHAADEDRGGGDSFGARAARALAASQELQSALRAAAVDESLSLHQRECMAAWAERIEPSPLEEIPAGLRAARPNHDGVDLVSVPFVQRAVPRDTKPLPPPPPPPEVPEELRALQD